MCGIIGIFGNKNASEAVLKGLSVMQNRGKDAYGIASDGDDGNIVIRKDIAALSKELSVLDDHDTSRNNNGSKKNNASNKISMSASMNALGHCLHSLVGFMPQPLRGSGGGLFSANCEIYNWKELDSRYSLGAKNDSDMILKLIELRISSSDKNNKTGAERIALSSVLDELDGVYAFVYWKDDQVILCRDIFGVKPIWYSTQQGLSFASEKKALLAAGYDDVKELNPREILSYDITTGKLSVSKRKFYDSPCLAEQSFDGDIVDACESDEDRILSELTGLLVQAISKRIPDQKFGILFSGGVDSVLIARVCKSLGVDFTCYTAALESEKEAEDLIFAKNAARKIGLDIKVKTISLDEVEEKLKTVIPLIEDNNVVKVGVGLTFYVACEMAKQDGVRVIFSGLGSEEIFAGYERHKHSSDVNDECLSGLRRIYERDTYRDDVITMNNNIELRLPFLDLGLVEYSLNIPASLKLDEKQNKKILRKAALLLKVPEEFALRKKKAAQYGSRFDKALEKLTKKSGRKSKSAYLDKFYSQNPSLGVLFSSGKDSVYAMHIMRKQNYPIRCLITMKSENPDSYMFHTPNIDIADLQAKAMQVPIVVGKTRGEKEEELEDMKKALEKAKKDYGIEGVVTGALYSQYQRERVEKVCDELGLKIFSPLWHMDQEKEMREILDDSFEIMMSSVAAEGLDKSWLGRRITQKDVDALVSLRSKIGLNVAGEGGEFETLVLDGPIFKKRIVIEDSEIIEESQNTARFVVKEARLEDKNPKSN